MESLGSEDARKRLPDLLERAHRNGESTVITKRGVPYAALVPFEQMPQPVVPPKLTELRGSGKGCYGDAAEFVRELRDEWN